MTERLMEQHNCRNTLDVGCGTKPRGNVNCDVKPVRNIENFVCCNACYLPFKDRSFDRITGLHVIEHLTNPLLALREMHRCSRRTVIIETPSPFGLFRMPDHFYSWNTHTLRNLLLQVFDDVEIYFESLSSRMELLKGRLGKYFQLINVVLSKMGFHPSLVAICKIRLSHVD